MQATQAIRIVIVEDQTILRQGLQSLIDQTEGMEIIGEAADGRAAVKIVEQKEPDVAIMDVAMPNLNGIEATRIITKQHPDVKVLALSQHGDEKYVQRILKAGAMGYLLKETLYEELARAVREVAAGRYYFSHEISSLIIRKYIETPPTDAGSAADALSDREREVLQLVAEGKTTKEIAELLSISVKTVETHRQQIMNKLDIHSIAELTRFALLEGIAFL